MNQKNKQEMQISLYISGNLTQIDDQNIRLIQFAYSA